MAEDEGFDKVELEDKDKDKDKRAKDGKEEKEEVGKIVFESETFSSMAWRKCKHFFTNITLEPVMLFYGIVGLVRNFFLNQAATYFFQEHRQSCFKPAHSRQDLPQRLWLRRGHLQRPPEPQG